MAIACCKFLLLLCSVVFISSDSASARRSIQQQSVHVQDEPDIALSPREEYAYDGYEYDLEEDNDDIENLPLLSPGEAYYEETCYSAPDVVASIKNSEYSLSIFHDALYTTGIIDLLRDPTREGTVFAPTNAAFEAAAAQLGLGIHEFLTSPQLVPIIMYHVIGYKLLTCDIWGLSVHKAIHGLEIRFEVSSLEGGEEKNTDNYLVQLVTAETVAYALDSDICNCKNVCNILVNVIDSVLLPRITETQTNGTDTLITMADELGGEHYFLIVEEELQPPASEAGLSFPPEKGSGLYKGGRELSPDETHGQVGRSVDMTYYIEEMLPPSLAAEAA